MIVRTSNPNKDQRLVPKLSNDVSQILVYFQSTNCDDPSPTQESIIRVIKSFLIYRPDFGYSQVTSLS